jgi:hypothetical protein
MSGGNGIIQSDPIKEERRAFTFNSLFLTFFFLNFNKIYKKFFTSNSLSNVKYNICQTSSSKLKRPKANIKILSIILYYFIAF